MQAFTVPCHEYSFGCFFFFFPNDLSVFSVDGNDFLPGSVLQIPSLGVLLVYPHVMFVVSCAPNLSSCYYLLGSKSPGGSGVQAHRKTLIGEPGQAANSKLELCEVFVVVFGWLVFLTGVFCLATFCAL